MKDFLDWCMRNRSKNQAVPNTIADVICRYAKMCSDGTNVFPFSDEGISADIHEQIAEKTALKSTLMRLAGIPVASWATWEKDLESICRGAAKKLVKEKIFSCEHACYEYMLAPFKNKAYVTEKMPNIFAAIRESIETRNQE